MRSRKRGGWMFMPATFVKLIGGDYSLLAGCETNVLKKHYVAAFTMCLTMVISVLSIGYAVELLFHSLLAEVTLATFVSLLFGCIYIFILNTFSKSVRKKSASMVNASNIIRTGFVIFMALMISKPIESYVFSERLDSSVQKYRVSLSVSYQRSLENLHKAEIKKLERERYRLIRRIEDFPSQADARDLKRLSERLTSLNGKRDQDLADAERRIGSSEFLLFRLQTVARYWGAWLISLIITALFLLPGYLIYSISSADQYYTIKKDKEHHLITREFERFRERYRLIFKEKWNVETEYYSCFSDPPFNSNRLTKPQALEADIFLAKYLD